MFTKLLERPATFADLLDRLGDVPPGRILLTPPPGEATEKDVLTLHLRENRLCELVDGVLVEKPMAFFEARGASVLSYYLEDFAWKNDLGAVLGADVMFRIMPHQVRIPDVAFVSWDKLPGRRFPKEAHPGSVSQPGRGSAERRQYTARDEAQARRISRRRRRTGLVRRSEKRTITVHASPTKKKVLTVKDTLTGGKVLPGFCLSLSEFFNRVGEKEK